MKKKINQIRSTNDNKIPIIFSITQSPPLGRDFRPIYPFEYMPHPWSLNDGFSMDVDFVPCLVKQGLGVNIKLLF